MSENEDAGRTAPTVRVTTMTVRVLGGERAAVLTAMRRAGQSVENDLLGIADTAWTIKEGEA